MAHVQALRCRECGREYPLEPLHVCEFCFGPLEVSYDYDAMHRNIEQLNQQMSQEWDEIFKKHEQPEGAPPAN